MKASAPATVRMVLSASDEEGSDSETVTGDFNITTAWQRYYVSLYIPEDLSPTNKLTMVASLTGTLATGVTVTVDNAQVEEAYKPSEYFDGSMPADFGVVWGGTAHASKSFYYLAKNIKIPRLVKTLSDWVPKNTPWRVRSYSGLEGDSGI
jgi:hypothetical protein